MTGFVDQFRDRHRLSRLKKTYTHPVERSLSELSKISDEQLQELSQELRNQCGQQDQLTTFNIIHGLTYACLAAERVLGLKPYSTQITAAAALVSGTIIEMKTGEGKTLAAALAAYVRSLIEPSVHVITVNDYLAKRDSQWMQDVYSFLGQDCGYLQHQMSKSERQLAYQMPIVYGSNNEFGFDYLRNQMEYELQQQVNHQFAFAVIDEADSILIDEARTPLIISGITEVQSAELLQIQEILSNVLQKSENYTLEAKDRQAQLTESGIDLVEESLNLQNLYDPQHIVTLNRIQQAVLANLCYFRDQHYLVEDDEIKVIDEFTGRLSEGRRWGDGLHQAIEAKEKVTIRPEMRTQATVTFQNYFTKYRTLSGMTGTILTDRQEVEAFYRVKTLEIPTYRPSKRIDLPDVVFKNQSSKLDYILETVRIVHQTGQPILLGTATVEQAERLSHLLLTSRIPHNMLSAKHHEHEAEIISQAGCYGAVTIATHLAGRGTDILLGGTPDAAIQELSTDETLTSHSIQIRENQLRERYQRERDYICQLGGLFVLGTERHEARRIDNQLRGRAGRQGDPGKTQFVISLEDELISKFGGKYLQQVMKKYEVISTKPLEMPVVTTAINRAQKAVEQSNFESRKRLTEFDMILHQQRETIYSQRQQILSATDNYNSLLEIFDDRCEDVEREALHQVEFNPAQFEKSQFNYFNTLLLTSSQLSSMFTKDRIESSNFLSKLLQQNFRKFLRHRFKQLSDFGREKLSQKILLQVLDQYWREHLTFLDGLREGIMLRSYARKKPIEEFKRESHEEFLRMIDNIQRSSLQVLLATKIQPVPKVTSHQKSLQKNELSQSA